MTKESVSSVMEDFSSVKEILKTAGDAISIYVPLIKVATDLIENIIEIYEAADYNKNICDALVERVKLANNAVDTLQRRKQKNENKLRDEGYYRAFNRFIYVLEEIKNFTADITKLHGFRKYTKAIYVKEKFIKLTEKYDTVMKDLQFTMAIANDEQRRDDDEALAEDLAEMTKYLEKMDEKVNNIHDELIYIKNHLGDKVLHSANKIDSKELIPPARGKSDDERRGKNSNLVVRRIFNGQEVACKSTPMTEEEMKSCSKTQGLLEMLMKLSECKHILRFHGVSKIDNKNVMVFEWAKHGTLRELYEKKDIQWHYKVRIALEICRGLIFLQKAEILHHDLKCQNILMTESLEPKIYNFGLARYNSDESTLLEKDDSVPWLAPEKLIDIKYRYSTHCEIFSFGMLLWELAFEKKPYEGWKVDKIKDHVIKGGRERIKFGDSTPEFSKLQEEYKRIINDTWKKNPQERISFLKVLDMLEELYDSIRHIFDDLPALLDDKSLDLDGSKSSDAELVIPDEEISPIISLEEGIQAFITQDHQKAWKCFNFHAENNNVTAKYWKGRYLWEGFHDGIKEREDGKKLLKEAADEGNSDAQIRYAFTLLKVLNKDDNRKIFMDYITKAATEGNNPIAQFNLGDILYKGKCKIPEDKNEGIKLLKKAALQDNSNATKLLNTLGIGIYDIKK